MLRPSNASRERITGPDRAPDMLLESPQLIDGREAARLHGMSLRTWLRLCDSGKAPWGVKLRGLRRWNVAELQSWVRDGCPTCRAAKGGVK